MGRIHSINRYQSMTPAPLQLHDYWATTLRKEACPGYAPEKEIEVKLLDSPEPEKPGTQWLVGLSVEQGCSCPIAAWSRRSVFVWHGRGSSIFPGLVTQGKPLRIAWDRVVGSPGSKTAILSS